MAVGQNARQFFLIFDKKVFVTHFLVFACMNLNAFIAEPTRTPYDRSKSAINRRFCYNQKEYQLSDILSFLVHRSTYNIRNGIIEIQILCCIALSLTGSFVIMKHS